MNSLAEIADGHGVFLRGDAVKIGVDDKALRRLRRSHDIHRLRHGAYVLGDVWAEADQRHAHLLLAHAAYRCCARPSVLSHTSAVLAHTSTYWDLDLGAAHLTRLDGVSGRRTSGLVQHRGLLRPGDLAQVAGLPTTAAHRAALELTTLVDVEHALVPINAMLHEQMFTVEQLRERYEQSMVFWPESLTTNLVLQLANARLESAGESRTFHLFWRLGLPRPELQYPIYDERGNLIGIVDFAWPELGIFLEFDGKQKYTKFLRAGEEPGDAVFREKQREDRIRRVTGWRCIRVVWADLERPQALAPRLLAEFGRAVA